jgi:hypothetical protein
MERLSLLYNEGGLLKMAVHECKKIYYEPEISKPVFKRGYSVSIFEEHHVVRITTKKLIIREVEPVLKSQYYFSGYVYELNISNPVSRLVRLYNRSTGELVSSTTSNLSGYYYLETPYNDDHYIIALDDETGTQYNLVALDWMTPLNIT